MLRRSLLLSAGIAAMLACPGAAWAEPSLASGDVLMMGWAADGHSQKTIWKLDPATLAPTLLTSGGMLGLRGQLVAASSGLVYFTNPALGLVSLDPRTLDQALVASTADLGGRAPLGLALAPDGALYLGASLGGVGSILRFDPATSGVGVVSQGGLLASPGCIAVAPDGALFVGEGSRSAVPSPREYTYGSIVRVEPTGEQSLVAGANETDFLFFGPNAIAVAPDGSIWSAQQGYVAGRGAYVLRTDPADGRTERIADSPSHSGGIVCLPDGTWIMGGCDYAVGPDCLRSRVYVYPAGASTLLWGGAFAVVPEQLVPTVARSWGALKARAR